MLTPIDPRDWVRVQNDSGMDIPPYSVVVCTSVTSALIAAYDPDYPYESEDTHHVTQWDGCLVGNIMTTGPVAIPSSAKGYACFDVFQYVSIDQTVSAPVSGEQWGPTPNQWYISRGGAGFFAQGYSANNVCGAAFSMFLRNYALNPRSAFCTSSSSSVSSSSSGGSSVSGSSGSSGSSVSGSVSGSGSSSSGCGCVTVVTGVSCSGGSLIVTYGSAAGCC